MNKYSIAIKLEDDWIGREVCGSELRKEMIQNGVREKFGWHHSRLSLWLLSKIAVFPYDLNKSTFLPKLSSTKVHASKWAQLFKYCIDNHLKNAQFWPLSATLLEGIKTNKNISYFYRDFNISFLFYFIFCNFLFVFCFVFFCFTFFCLFVCREGFYVKLWRLCSPGWPSTHRFLLPFPPEC